MLAARADEGRPVRVGLIGAGKFGSMYLAQIPSTKGVHMLGIADLSVERAKEACGSVGWEEEQANASSFEEAMRTGGTYITEDAMALIQAPYLDVIVDATGDPSAGIQHALAAIDAGRHIVMVNVEADTLAGPLLAEKARKAGVVYSMAYGDQPALIAEMVDWARVSGFRVIAAGKGTKYLPGYHAINPDTVWNHYGITPERASEGGMNPRMFSSFMDGTKSAIEMAAVANACDLEAPVNGLRFPACGVDDLPHVLRPEAHGGSLEDAGLVEVVAAHEIDGRPVFRDLRWGVYVTFEGVTPYARRCFQEYGLKTDASGRYAALYKPYHLIGLELGISVASAALRKEATGSAWAWRGDVVAVAKKALRPGDVLDGEGGFCVWGKLMPASASLASGGLPIGLAHGVTVKRSVSEGHMLSWSDVACDETLLAVQTRREMERHFSNGPAKA